MSIAPILKLRYGRWSAFFCNEELSPEEYAKAVVETLGFKGKFDLSLDRSNWKYGKKEINYLVLSWRINRHISIPLMFIELDKAGNSNTDERLNLLEKFSKIFGFDRIKSLAADREFIGKKWFKELHKHNIPYFIRVKENILLPWGGRQSHPCKGPFSTFTRGPKPTGSKGDVRRNSLFCRNSIQGWGVGHCDEQSGLESLTNPGQIS